MTAESLRRFAAVGDGHYSLTDDALGLQFEVSRLRRDHHELIGELSVLSTLRGASTVDGALSIGSFNLSSPRAREDRARSLAKRARTGTEVDWLGYLEEICQRALAAERIGQPAVLLRDVPRPRPTDGLYVDGLQMLREHPVIWFGDGGTAKSYLALYVAGHLAQRGLTVLMADWELAADDHRERLERLFGPGELPPVLYARCDRPMAVEVDRLRRLVQRDEVNFVVCDSIAFACDGPPEAAEVAARYFQAVRQIGVGSLHLAHTNRSERADEKPFGSAFWHNGARATWHVKLAQTATDGQGITVGLYNKKSNLGPLSPAVAFDVQFEPERTRFTRVDLADIDELAEGLPLWQRIRQVVKRRPETLAVLADELGTSVDTLERTIRRRKTMFARVSGEDGVTRIGLAERRAA